MQMETPVYDFVQSYIQNNPARFHMPGHKGKSFLGCEPGDITEVFGADVLSESQGIIGASQKNACTLFGTGATYYSTEGSSLSIKAMLAAAWMAWKEERQKEKQNVKRKEKQNVEQNEIQDKKQKERQHGDFCDRNDGRRPWVLAARNIHRAMIDGCALLDLEVQFIPWKEQMGICSTVVESSMVREILSTVEEKPIGVYLTSPDYLGMQSDIASIAKVCREYHVPLLVDNAHGSYLAFLQENRHPIALGADMCCDSAHKTLPVLTGGGYLHVSKTGVRKYGGYIRKAMTLFGSTSPSYLILQSLDLCNRYLAEHYREKLEQCVCRLEQLRQQMRSEGIPVLSGEPLKLVIDAGECGCSGYEISQEMREGKWRDSEGHCRGIECEYADDRFVVLMVTPENSYGELECLESWLQHTRWKQKKGLQQKTLLQQNEQLQQTNALQKKTVLQQIKPFQGKTVQRMTIRQAVFSASEMVPVENAVGRILAQETVSCPPAIPIGISGEEITPEMAEVFRFYGIEKVAVVESV